MSKALGWVLIITLILLAGTHPGALAGLTQQTLGLLHQAGNELASFAAKL